MTDRSAITPEMIEAVAEKMWRVHPKELQDQGITRQQFYAREITALLARIKGAEG